ncbi:aldehyde dehydrogenase family protein [Nocardioides zeae]
MLALPSADPDAVRTALVRGAFEYAGQKCSAASRAYVARSVWERIREQLVADVDGLSVGDPTDLSHFLGAVIDDRSFAKQKAAIDRAHATPGLDVAAGGTYDDSTGWFVRPTLVVADDPTDEMFRTEYFGPVLVLHVFEDADAERVTEQLEGFAPYALTGAVFARDPREVARASATLRFAAGNFYVNDKPTGAVVGQQPFGGGRASGTNDKAGAASNLLRWTSPRSVKETFVPPTDHRYPHQG